MKKKTKLVITSFILALCIIGIIFGFTCFYRSLKKEIKNEKTKTMYASILEKGKNYIKVSDENNKDLYYLKYNKDDLEVGEIIAISYIDKVDNYKNIEVIVHNDEDIASEIINLPIKTTTTTTTTTKISSTRTTTTSTTKKVENSSSVSDDEIINDIKLDYEEINKNNDRSISSTVKDKFIMIVDFIFYGTEIKGRTFASLTSEAKAKVVYYALLIDNKIDNKWPDYKKNLSDKYQDIKAKLLAKYLEITTSVCSSNENNGKLCKNLTNDFGLLKKTLNITWDVIKKSFIYAYDKSSNALIRWYELFSGKV